jgi:hypothetical protein
VFWNQLAMIPHKTGFAIALVALFVSVRLRWAIPALCALVALPVLAYADHGPVGSNCNTTVLALTAPFLYAALRDRSAARPLFLGIWLPSLVTSLGLAWASSVHVLSEGYAQVPALITATVLAVMLAREIAPLHSLWPALAWSTVVIASYLVHLRQPYNDDVAARLDTRLADGPWRGIATTREKALYVQAIQAGVHAFADEGKRVMFLTHFPAGYLMTSMRPAVSSVWAITCPGEAQWDACADALERDLDRFKGQGILVFDMRRTFHSVEYSAPLSRGAVHKVLEECLESVLVTPEYTLYYAR